MSVKVYVVTDQEAINFMVENDIDGFKDYLSEEEFLNFGDPEIFDSEEAAIAFCAGLGYGVDERAPIERYPLRSSEVSDLPYIELIENY